MLACPGFNPWLKMSSEKSDPLNHSSSEFRLGEKSDVIDVSRGVYFVRFPIEKIAIPWDVSEKFGIKIREKSHGIKKISGFLGKLIIKKKSEK